MDTENLIIIGNRVLIKPEAESQRNKFGLYLPPGVMENAGGAGQIYSAAGKRRRSRHISGKSRIRRGVQ